MPREYTPAIDCTNEQRQDIALQPVTSNQIAAIGYSHAFAELNKREAASSRTGVLCPWPDYIGTPIRHGDRLSHPDGTEFVAVFLNGYDTAEDSWRAVYDAGPVSRLCLQIGDKGQAVLITQPDQPPT